MKPSFIAFIHPDLEPTIQALAGFKDVVDYGSTIGIGANTTIFSVVNGALMRPLPYPEGDRLVVLWEILPSAGLDTVPLSVADYLDYREQVHTLSSLALMRSTRLALTGSADPVMPRGMAVSPSLLPMVGAQAALGRVFRADEEEPGRSRVVMLSYGFWQSRFGGDRTVIGRTISLNDLSYEVVGVLARDVQFPPPVTFGGQDAKALPFPDSSLDAVTVGFGMRNIPDTILALKEIWRVLKPGGRFICLELTKPQTPVLSRLYCWYLSRFMPFVSNLVMKSSAPYLYLPRSIQAFYQPPEFREVIVRSGFSNVAVDSLTLGIATVYRACKRT